MNTTNNATGNRIIFYILELSQDRTKMYANKKVNKHRLTKFFKRTKKDSSTYLIHDFIPSITKSDCEGVNMKLNPIGDFATSPRRRIAVLDHPQSVRDINCSQGSFNLLPSSVSRHPMLAKSPCRHPLDISNKAPCSQFECSLFNRQVLVYPVYLLSKLATN